MRYIYVILGLLFFGPTQAAWIDWTTTSSGTMDVNGTTVNVTLTGNPVGVLHGDDYFNNWATVPADTYIGMAPTDAIHTSYAGSYTLTFDREVEDLYMALFSVGRSNVTVIYDFNDPFTVLSHGPNFWGYAGYSVSGDDLIGNEYNGILEFQGRFSSISFDIVNDEHFHGFNFSATALPDNGTGSVPEPSLIMLLGTAIAGFGFARKNAKA
jgi:hypothetical protein